MVFFERSSLRRRSPLGILALLLGLTVVAASCGSSDNQEAGEGGETSEANLDDESVDEAVDESTTDESEDGDAEAAGTADEPEGDEADGAEADDAGELFPDVLAATATADGGGNWTFSATLSSPYDSAERYADAWRVVGPDGEVYGIRELAHDHASEQPFTRSQSGIAIPDGVGTVIVEGRDQVSGWGGATVEVALLP